VNLTQETPIVNINTGNITTVSRTAIVRKSGSTEKSVFGNLTAHLGHFELSGGLRHIDYKSHSSLQQGAVVTNTQRDHDHATVYLASAKYQITRDIMVYALTGSSWRPGPRVVGDFSVGPNGTSGPSALERQFTDLPPERSKSYEIGTKTSFLNGRGRFNVSAYYQKFKELPIPRTVRSLRELQARQWGATPEVGTFNFVSPVPVTVKGVEAEASFQILRRWSVGANVAYSDGRIKGGTIACTDLDKNGVPDTNVTTPTLQVLQAALPPGQTLAVCPGINRRALTSPKFSANLQSEFGFGLAEGVDGFLRGSATIFGSTRNDPSNTFDDVGSYGLLNLFAGVRDKDGAWEVTLFGKNILRERQVLNVGSGVLTTTYRSPAVNTFVSQYRSISVTAPREFGITLRVATGSR
jgi:iron complex outermembrane receptor protein